MSIDDPVIVNQERFIDGLPSLEEFDTDDTEEDDNDA